MSDKNCLTCKYEPEWGAKVGIEYPRMTGMCQWAGDLPKMPQTHTVKVEHITRYSDDSGIMHSCAVWEEK